MSNPTHDETADMFQSARWYDLGINWDARLEREIPVLCDVFGPPGALGLLDAACGPGHQLSALAKAGYRVTGLDSSPAMMSLAREHLAACGVEGALLEARFDELSGATGPFDGVYCIGNSLAATGSAELAKRSVAALASVLRPRGRMFVQILNFEKLRRERPCVRGPRVRMHEGIEYVSNRCYAFYNETVEVTNLTVWNDQGWKRFASTGSLYAISEAQITAWCAAGGLHLEALYGSYEREPFDQATSNDLIVVCAKSAASAGGERERT